MIGDIEVSSVAGKGSRFVFSSSFEIGKTITRITPAKFEQLKNLKVLIIDDNLTNRRILEGQLKDVK